MAWVCQHATSNSLGVLSSGTPPIPIPDAVNIPCSCQNPHTVLNVTCVYMDCLKEIKVQHFLKCPAAIQLLELGLFPCAPVQPGLAVSLVMLEWACTLFLHMASNMHMLKSGSVSWRRCARGRRNARGMRWNSMSLGMLQEAKSSVA